MSRSSNVIDISKRRAAKRKTSESSLESGRASETPVVDMTERRQAILSSERRQVKRTILSEFIGAFILVPEKGLQRVSLYDISANGVAFDMELSGGMLMENEEIAMRVYLNQFTYFPFVISIANARVLLDDGVSRYGCNFIRNTVNSEALFHFVKFIETVSASLKTDSGDVMVSNVGR